MGLSHKDLSSDSRCVCFVVLTSWRLSLCCGLIICKVHISKPCQRDGEDQRCGFCKCCSLPFPHALHLAPLSFSSALPGLQVKDGSEDSIGTHFQPHSLSRSSAWHLGTATLSTPSQGLLRRASCRGFLFLSSSRCLQRKPQLTRPCPQSL